MLGVRDLFRLWGTITLYCAGACGPSRPAPRPADEPTVEDLKARALLRRAFGDRPHLCVQIAQKQLAEADKLYAASEVEKGQAALTDVVAFSELARDYCDPIAQISEADRDCGPHDDSQAHRSAALPGA